MGLLFPKVPRGTVCAQMKIQAFPLALPPHVSLRARSPSRSSKKVFFSLGPQDLQNKLALVQSITDFSSAFHAVGGSACFNTSLKGKLLEILMVSS